MKPAQSALEQNPSSRKRTQSELEQKLSSEKKSYSIEKRSFSSLIASNNHHKLAQEALSVRFRGKLDGEAGAYGNVSAIVFGFPMGPNKWRSTKPMAGTSGAANLSPSYHAERKALAKLINQCIENNEPGFSTLEPIQTHQKNCSLRLVSNGSENFLNAVKKVDEIIIANNNSVFTIFYKERMSERISDFRCNKELAELLLTLPFEGNILLKNKNTNIYEQVYKEVESKRGYTNQIGETELTLDVFLPFQAVLVGQKISVIIYTERVPCNQSSSHGDNTCDNFFKAFFENIPLRLIYSVELSDGDTMGKNLKREYSEAREAFLFIRDRYVSKEKVRIDQELLENIFTIIKKDEIFSYDDKNLNREALSLFYSRICSYKTIFEDMIKLDSIGEKSNTLSRFLLPQISLPQQPGKSTAVSIVEQKADDFPDKSLFFMRSMRGARDQKKEINCKYQYEDNDIQTILSARLNEIVTENVKLFIKPVKILAAVDNVAPLQLETRLKQEKEHNSGKRVLLIPCNLQNLHWVSILVEIDEGGQVLRAEYIDSLIAVPIIPKKIQEQLKKIYPQADFRPRTLLKQSGYNSCGAYVIENLLMAAFGAGIRTSNEEEKIRDLHLTALIKYDKDFCEKFYERQKNNRPTTAVFHENLGFTDTIKGIWFSKKELARILEIKKCLSHLSENLKSILLTAFNYKPLDDNYQLHLYFIRKALEAARKLEPESLVELIRLLFDIGLGSEERLNVGSLDLYNLKFKVNYEEILAVVKKELTPEEFDNLSEALAKEIQSDEQLALKLQIEEWNSEDAAPHLPRRTMSLVL